jgi:hypothetical protein
MVAVFLSGVAGRFIYLQIPRSIEGRELSLNEIRSLKINQAELLKTSNNLQAEDYNKIIDAVRRKPGKYHKSLIVSFISNSSEDRRSLREARRVLNDIRLPKPDHNRILSLLKSDISINRRIESLDLMQNLFKYWHVAHLPFALVMLIIMLIHVGVTILFGYKWIF